MGVLQDAQSFAERAHLYSSRIGTVWWFVNFFFRVLIVGGMAKDFLGNELKIALSAESQETPMGKPLNLVLIRYCNLKFPSTLE